MDKNALFRLGMDVNFALPVATIKPKDAEMRQSAKSLRIKTIQAWRAWIHYTFFSGE